MRAVRRSALLFLPVLCALTSCGVPATGVVEAGGPASGVLPTIWVSFVADGALVAVPRRTVAPVDVESAVRVLLQGPYDAERVKGITTLLPPSGGLPTAVPSPTTRSPDSFRQAPQKAAGPSDLVKVTTLDDRVSIELRPVGVDLPDLATAQLICTAVAAQRVADPEAQPAPVTVTGPDGRRVEATDARCPGL
ncbi:hypothetical protein [Streptomyces cellulosae]|uniref:hypothetical protein n=1 Tax=Streptomyces cellulosae TaxID=1968 RepID=UPI00068954CD|nr:hypothetical protein [Streptomyces cellulosae]